MKAQKAIYHTKLTLIFLVCFDRGKSDMKFFILNIECMLCGIFPFQTLATYKAKKKSFFAINEIFYPTGEIKLKNVLLKNWIMLPFKLFKCNENHSYVEERAYSLEYHMILSFPFEILNTCACVRLICNQQYKS